MFVLALRDEVERVDPDVLEDVARTRRLLIEGALRATSALAEEGTPEAGPFGEREDFVRFVMDAPEADLARTEPIPYRRLMVPAESRRAWETLHARWGIQPYGWVLRDEHPPTDAQAFEREAFQCGVPLGVLVEMLHARGVERAWVLNGCDCLRDVEWLEDEGCADLTYWCDESADWVVFFPDLVDHAIVLRGWILDCVRETWPQWEQHVWQPEMAEDFGLL